MTKPRETRPHESFAAMAGRVFPDLPPEELTALEGAWRHVTRWLDRLPRERPYEDEPAHCFTAPKAKP